MELLPYWEPDMGCNIPDKLWFVVHNNSNNPGMRTGHAALVIQTSLIISCGANPDGAFADLIEFDFTNHRWNKFHVRNLVGRYEHTMFTCRFHPKHLFLFAGCLESGNSNEVLSIDLTKHPLECEPVETKGELPSPRTFSSSSCWNDENFYVFGGGLETSKAVSDPHVYILQFESMSWKKLRNSGSTPSPRQGHSLSVVNSQLVCFGGMNAGEFYGDVFTFDLKAESWQKIKSKGSIPCPRAAHASCVVGDKIIINGGLCLDVQGSLQDLYILNTSNWKWQLVNVQGPLPGNRLGHCIVPVSDFCLSCYESSKENRQQSRPEENVDDGPGNGPQIVDVTADFVPRNAAGSSEVGESRITDVPMLPLENAKNESEKKTDVNKFIVFGGLDTNGIIFDDTLLIKLL